MTRIYTRMLLLSLTKLPVVVAPGQTLERIEAAQIAGQVVFFSGTIAQDAQALFRHLKNGFRLSNPPTAGPGVRR